MLKIKPSRKNKKTSLALKLAGVLVVAAVGVFVWTKISVGADRPFAPADDFPRGALCYAQFRDLPGLLEMWEKSKLKEDYLASDNFKQFQNRHLALKLHARWQEFNDALGFELNPAALAGATDRRAAVAVYDIGKLEMVFIARASDAKFAATMFFQNQEQFEENPLAGGGIYYSREVEADRGRQKQKIVFAAVKERFVLATSETLLLRTLANINGKTDNDRLSDEPQFQALTERLNEPHLATVWVDQARLNEDWYFKRYWVMRNLADLRNIRAGIFDFEKQNDKLIERREFLLNENEIAANEIAANEIAANAQISIDEAARLQALVPPGAPFFKLQSIAEKPDRAALLLRDTFLDRLPAPEPNGARRRWHAYDGFDSSGDSDDGDRYYYLNWKYDASIDETDDDSAENDKKRLQRELEKILQNDLQQILIAAQPSAAVTATEPQSFAAPLFVDFRKTTIFSLRSPDNVDRAAFENAIAALVQNRLATGGENLDLIWSDRAENDQSWRELRAPALSNWKVCYALQNNDLIVAGAGESIASILTNPAANSQPPEQSPAAFDQLTVVRLDRRKPAFDDVMSRLAAEEKRQIQSTADQSAQSATVVSDFFTGNLASLLDAAAAVKRIEVKTNRFAEGSREEIVFYLD